MQLRSMSHDQNAPIKQVVRSYTDLIGSRSLGQIRCLRGSNWPLVFLVPAIEKLVDMLLVEGIVGHDLLRW